MYSAPENGSLRPTVALIDLDAFRANLRSIHEALPDRARLVAVLKADGYGHGAVRLARVAEKEKVKMLAVALLEEGLDLRRNGIRAPILCLGPIYDDGLPVAVEYDITPGISDPVALDNAASHARVHGALRVHLKLDSGMNRMGLAAGDLDEAIETLTSSPIEVAGIYSHFANASSPDDHLNAIQQKRFAAMLSRLASAGIEVPLHHFANSAGIFSGFAGADSWARSGIALYGGNPMDEDGPELAPVMSLVTRINRLKWIETGETVGYGASWKADRPTRLATLPIGYADGYPRSLSNRAEVLVRGVRCPVVGRVSMDLVTIDVTAIDDVAHGDEVVLLGRQGSGEIRAEELARLAGTINYEIFTNVSARVPRRWIAEGSEAV